MNILILGNNSFIGKSIIPELTKSHLVYHTSHEDLDLTNIVELQNYFKYYKQDILINCACSGGSYKEDNNQVFCNNIDMLTNLINNKDKYKRLIVFGSGVEFLETPISQEHYCNSKKVCGGIVKNNNQVIKLNLWNIFGKFEDSRRFISKCINNCRNGTDIIIDNDRYFDFFYIGDLIKVIKHLIDNPPESYFEMDVVYQKKYKLSEVAETIKRLTNSSVNVKISSESYKNYIGNGDKLHDLELNLVGLEEGIEDYING